VATTVEATYIFPRVIITTGRRKMRPALYVLLGVLLVPTVGLVGDVVTDGKFKSTQSSFSLEPPLEVDSPVMVENLNADMVDGVEGTDLYTKAEVDALVAAVTDACAPRQYYLTSASHPTGEVHAACATGFHFANLYEIQDVSNLRYARYHPDAYFHHDSGLGPPVGAWGWVRTGYFTNSDSIPGRGNCDLWTSTSAADHGSMVRLNRDWALADGVGWEVETTTCSATTLVWCVED
jgi:hypothetical protein